MSTPKATGTPVSSAAELESGGRLAGDVVEVRRLAADHAAESDDAGVAARLRKRHRAERQLERARHGHHRDRLLCDPGLLELGERRREQPVHDLAVEARDDDADAATRVPRLALEQVDVVGNVEVARRVLPGEAERRLVTGVLHVRLVVVRVVVSLFGVGLVEVVVLVGLVGVDFLDLVFDRQPFARPRLALAHSLSESNFSP